MTFTATLLLVIYFFFIVRLIWFYRTLARSNMASRSLYLAGFRTALVAKSPSQAVVPKTLITTNEIPSSLTAPWLTLIRGKRKKPHSKRSLAAFTAPPPTLFKDVEFPEATHARAGEDPLAARRLPEIPKVPEFTDWHRPGKPPKHSRDLANIRGPELIHNDLVHKQYAVVAQQGGFLRHEHFEFMRTATNKMLDFNKVFAQYRVDPLYQSWTKKSVGQRGGGGKGSIHHYVTPIREGRVILEVAGHATYEEVYRCLRAIAHSLPFQARAISYEEMVSDKDREKYLETVNLNPFTLDYCIKYNMMGCWRYTSYYDYLWKMKYL